MGNVFTKKLTSRQKICKLLNVLPNWFFEPTSRVIINPAVLRIRDELDNYCELEWDSALDYSIDSLDSKFSEKHERKRRHTISCHDNNNPVNTKECFDCLEDRNVYSECSCDQIHSTDMEDIKNEIRLLRDQISNLLLQKQNDSTCTSTPIKCEIPAPPPPPLPIDVINNKPQDVELVAANSILKEIANVKLRPIKTNKSSEKRHDVRNDLHTILKKRYAVMHSPCPSLIYTEYNESNNENQAPYNFTIQPQEIIC